MPTDLVEAERAATEQAARIRAEQARHRPRITHGDLARHAGCSYSTVSKALSGHLTYNVAGTLDRLEAALKAEIESRRKEVT